MNRRYLFALLTLFVVVSLPTSIPAQSGLPVTPASGQAPIGTFRFVAFGDMGTGGKNQYAIARRMTIYHDERPYDTVIMLGDNIYESGKASDLPRKFEQPYAELLNRGVRFYATLGNHDVRRGREAQIKYKGFNMGGQAYYTFTKGDGLIEFFVLDSTRVDNEQLRWLDEAQIPTCITI